MRMLIALFLISLPELAWSQQNICELVPDRTARRVTLPRTPNYFFKMSPDGKNLYYIANNANWLFNMDTQQETRLPGTADPVPSPDGGVLTFISRGQEGGWRIGAMKLSPRWTGINNGGEEIGMSGGSYQSVGSQKPNGDRPFFYLDESTDKIVIRNLREVNGRFSLSSPVMEMGGEGKYRLPMLSPDGRRFSVLNTVINKTQIFELGPDQRPRLIDTLPVAGGKASFSNDGNSITFHMTRTLRPTDEETKYPAILGGDSALRNVYAYDLRTKEIDQITDNVGKDSYFPIFLASGQIAFIDMTPDGKFHITISGRNSSQSSRKFSDVKDCFGPNVESELKRLGNLWAKTCQKWSESTTSDSGIALTAGLNIPVNVCIKLAERARDPSLRKLCDALDGKRTVQNPTATTSQRSAVVQGPGGEQIFRNQCAICHEGQEKKILSSPSLSERLAGTKSNRMPPRGRVLNAREAGFLKEYLRKSTNSRR